MFTVVLVEPQIPQNTGNIARTCLAAAVRLHLVGQLGFELSAKQFRRAGLDYWSQTLITHFPNKQSYLNQLPIEQTHWLTTHSTRPYTQQTFKPGDFLLFGNETCGMDAAYQQKLAQRSCTIPISTQARCLNLSIAVGITVFEGLRQNNFSPVQLNTKDV